MRTLTMYCATRLLVPLPGVKAGPLKCGACAYITLIQEREDSNHMISSAYSQYTRTAKRKDPYCRQDNVATSASGMQRHDY